METHPAKPSIDSAHTLLCARYQSERGVKLHQPPLSEYEATLSDPSDYGPTQQLGSAMRQAGVDAFEYISARDTNKGRCVGLFTPFALAQKKPVSTDQWLCETRADQVIFKPLSQNRVHRFPSDLFMINGQLPRPA